AHPESLEAVAALLHAKHDTAVNVRALAANRRLGTLAAAERIARFLNAPDLARVERLEALNTLASWTQPNRLDPVDGRYFPVSANAPSSLEVAFGAGLWKLSKATDTVISQKAIAILAKLKPSAARWQEVVAKLGDESASATVRVEWLRWLWLQDAEKSIAVSVAALSAQSAVLRRAAAEELITAQAAPQKLEQYLLSTLERSSDRQEVQHALSRLSSVTAPERVLLPMLEDLLTGKLEKAIQLDVIEAATTLAASQPGVQERLDRYRSAVARKGPLAQYDVSLEGGDAAVGKSLFLGHTMAACSKCHALARTDKQVGPSLEGIASRHPREYLLQSIVSPQTDVVAGYGIISLTLNDGSSVVGTLMDASKESLSIELPDGRRVEHAQTAIASKTKPLSTMPDMRTILSKRELRDLVAFLATLR
ncbi:MAG: c-type cytochrome, partial [bacterium]|nr:c-type cytochrome [bacterium]